MNLCGKGQEFYKHEIYLSSYEALSEVLGG